MVYINTAQKEAIALSESVKTTMTVSREGDFIRSDDTEVDEIEYFRGDQNTLTMNQTYTKTFRDGFIKKIRNLVEISTLVGPPLSLL